MSVSYAVNPTNCYFVGQDPDEKILLLLRAHPITTVSWIIPAFVMFFIPYTIPYVLPLTGLSLPQFPEAYRFAFMIFVYLLVLVMVIEGFLHWYFNVYFVTNKRIIDIDFKSILSKHVDIAKLADVQEAKGSNAGLLGTIFNYGEIMVQTSGAKVEIDFHRVPNPSHVADLIIDASDHAKKQGI